MALALIVLDNRAEADQLATVLRAMGLRTEWHPDRAHALERSRVEEPELIVADMREGLGSPDAVDPFRLFRCHPPLVATPLVCVGKRTRPQGVRVGPWFEVPHPWSAAHVHESVQKARRWRAGLRQADQFAEVEIEFPSVPHHLFDATELLTGMLETTTMTHDQLRQMRQAFLEMGQNAIEWGNRLDPAKWVHVRYRGFRDRVEITVRDEGPGFDIKKLPHAATAEDPIAHLDVRQELGLRDGGFGLLIVRGMVDELTYNELGNEVTLTRRVAPMRSSSPPAHKLAAP